MPDAAQFTLNLFDSVALGSTIDAPKTWEPSEASPELELDTSSPAAAPQSRGTNFQLKGDRGLARGWHTRAKDNIAAIRLSKELEASGRTPTIAEQEQLIRFTGFGATELAQNCFPLPGKSEFRSDWEEIGRDLTEAVSPAEYAALQRATQYAHYTPEPIIHTLWQAAQRLGFTGGRVLEPGMGTGLFFALLPEALRSTCRLTGVEYDPVTARIARFIHPEAQVRCEDYTRSTLRGEFDLAIGNPPFADRIVRADSTMAALGLRLHDYFIARSIARLRPGGIALFVTSTGTMDKTNHTARQHIASMADLIGAVRLPECSMRATAGTDVVIDVLAFQRRAEGQKPSEHSWMQLVEIVLHKDAVDASTGGEPHEFNASDDVCDDRVPGVRRGVVQINEYFAAHPEMVLGEHAQRRGICGPGLTYTCRSRAGAPPLERALTETLSCLPAGIFIPLPKALVDCAEDSEVDVQPGTAAEGATIKEGSYFVGKAGRLMQIVNGSAVVVPLRNNKGGEGITPKAAKIIRALLPIRDAVRDVLRAQAADRPWAQAQIRLRTAYSIFIPNFLAPGHASC